MYPTPTTTVPAGAPRDTNRVYRQWVASLSLPPGVKATLNVIVTFMYGPPTAWPSAPTIAEARGVKVRQIRKDTARLVREKILRKVPPPADARRRQATVTYVLLIPSDLVMQAYLPRSADVHLERSADVLQDMGGVSCGTPEVKVNHKDSSRVRVRAGVPTRGRATAPRGGAPAYDWRTHGGRTAGGAAGLSATGKAARDAVHAVLAAARSGGLPATWGGLPAPASRSGQERTEGNGADARV